MATFKDGGVRALMMGLVDYAGLFPPAALSLPEAIQEYEQAAASCEHWMLGRFVIPVVLLQELTAYASSMSNLSVIATATDSERLVEQLQKDFVLIEKGRAAGLKVSSVEVAVMGIPDDAELAGVSELAARHAVRIFLELSRPYDAEWREAVPVFLDRLARCNSRIVSPVGYKLRTGGVTADAFPSPDQLADALIGCAVREIPQKFTAGLHHPVRMDRPEIQAKMHGFLNVFVGGMLARCGTVSRETLIELLEDESPSSFWMDGQRAGWKNHSLPVSAVAAMRKEALLSYGCCSFTEPVEELKELLVHKGKENQRV